MKVGIFSYYYKNYNYGGLLQAYALCDYLNRHCPGVQCEQVCFARESKSSVRLLLRSGKLVKKACGYAVKMLRKPFHRDLPAKFAARNAAFEGFAQSIPHSTGVFDSANVEACADDYNLYITGSDQVWNLDRFHPAFFLNFTKKPKISYAASIGAASLSPEWQETFRGFFADFTALSVREEGAVDLLRPLSPVPVEWVLDPTLLLSADEWDEVCAPCPVEGPYLFCYFLGGSKRDRRVAKEVAAAKGLKIVTLPHVIGSYRPADKDFGEEPLWEVSPARFISLIKHADFILTDSFHGSVFANIYRRPFAAFEREGEKGMGVRLRSLTALTGTEERFLSTPEMATAAYICALPDTLPDETEELRQMRETSAQYLRRHVGANA